MKLLRIILIAIFLTVCTLFLLFSLTYEEKSPIDKKQWRKNLDKKTYVDEHFVESWRSKAKTWVNKYFPKNSERLDALVAYFQQKYSTIDVDLEETVVASLENLYIDYRVCFPTHTEQMLNNHLILSPHNIWQAMNTYAQKASDELHKLYSKPMSVLQQI